MSCRRIFHLATICALNTQLTSAYRLTDNGDQSGKQMMADAIKAAQVNPWMSTFEDSTLMPLSEMTRRPVERKKWGVDNGELSEYWFNSKIHSFGNTGIFGGLHAAMAPMATKLIDDLAYKGIDARVKLAECICQDIKKEEARILDLCWQVCNYHFERLLRHCEDHPVDWLKLFVSFIFVVCFIFQWGWI